MTIKEMRDFLNDVTTDPCFKICKVQCCLGNASCPDAIYKWLQSEERR